MKKKLVRLERYSTAPPEAAVPPPPPIVFNPFSFNTSSSIVKSNIPDRSGRGFPLAKNPKS